MSVPLHRSSTLLIALAVGVALAGCGRPEQDAYTQPPEGATSGEVKTPAPSLPAWAPALIGQPLAAVVKGSVPCKGFVDVAIKHTGAHPGSSIEGWAWDVKDHQPLARVIFTDPQSRIVGGADMKLQRPDVMKAMADVKSPRIGWSGVARPTSGVITAIGLTGTDASCVIATRAL